MRKFLIIVIFLLLLLLIGWLFSLIPLELSSEKISLIEEEKDTKLTNVWIFVYFSQSIKAQPELVTVINNPTELRSMSNWIASGIQTSLPANLLLKSVYIIDFEYSRNDKVVNHQYFMYVESSNEDYYIKEFDSMKDYYLDKYDDCLGYQLLNIIGRDNWYLASMSDFYSTISKLLLKR